MADLDRLSQIDVVERSGSEESDQDEGSDGDGERWYLSRQSVFNKMLHMASRMSQKDRQQQKLLLSLALSAIDKADANFRSDSQREKRTQEVAHGKGTSEKETQGEALDSLSSVRSQTQKTWSPEDLALVKELRAKNVGWGDISRHHLPGRTGNQIRARYAKWLEKNKDFEDEEILFEGPEPDGDEELEIEIGWSDSRVYEQWLMYLLVFTSHIQDGLPAQKDADEGMPQAPPTLGAFEMKRKANMAENQALLDQIAPPMETPRRLTKEKRKRPPTPSTPPNPTRRSERNVSSRRTI
jgi:hypothetical protein